MNRDDPRLYDGSLHDETFGVGSDAWHRAEQTDQLAWQSRRNAFTDGEEPDEPSDDSAQELCSCGYCNGLECDQSAW
jgi:hypothetical protein